MVIIPHCVPNPSIFFVTKEILYNIIAVSDQGSPNAVGVPNS